MSIVIAEIAEEGIVLSADKRVGRDNKWKDNCIKAFAVGDKTAIGVVGRNVPHPRTIKILLNKNVDKINGQTVHDRSLIIAGLIVDHNKQSDAELQMILIVVGYDLDVPHIYEIEAKGDEVRAPKERSPYLASNEKIHYDLTGSKLQSSHQKNHKKESYPLTRDRHNLTIIEASGINDTISPTSDNYLISLNSIKRI